MTEKEFNKIFSDNLNYYMNKTNTSRGDLAKLLNVSVTSVANWCRGQKTPRMDKVDRMCAHFGVKRSDLMSESPSYSSASGRSDQQPSASLAPAERQLLDNYRQLNDEGQEIIQTTAAGLVASGRYIKNNESDVVEEA